MEKFETAQKAFNKYKKVDTMAKELASAWASNVINAYSMNYQALEELEKEAHELVKAMDYHQNESIKHMSAESGRQSHSYHWHYEKVHRYQKQYQDTLKNIATLKHNLNELDKAIFTAHDIQEAEAE